MSKQTKYFIKQKLAGIATIVLSILIGFIDGDVTASIVILPFGLWLLFSKQMIFTNEYFFEVENNEDGRS